MVTDGATKAGTRQQNLVDGENRLRSNQDSASQALPQTGDLLGVVLAVAKKERAVMALGPASVVARMANVVRRIFTVVKVASPSLANVLLVSKRLR